MPAPFDDPRPPVLTPQAVGITVVAALAVAVCVVLGVWQWNRGNVVVTEPPAGQPVVAVERVVTAAGADDPARSVLSGDEVGRRVEVTGTFDPAVDLLVAGRPLQGRDGSWAVGVVELPDGSGVPVVRGWVPQGQPAPALPVGPVDLEGVVQPPESSDLAPSSAALPQGQVRIVSAADLVNRVDYPVANAYVTQTSPQAGLVAVPAADPGQAERHLDLRNLAYAAQWWVFAAFAIAVWIRALRDGRRDPDDELGAEPGDEPGDGPQEGPGEDQVPGGPHAAAGDGLGGRDIRCTR